MVFSSDWLVCFEQPMKLIKLSGLDSSSTYDPGQRANQTLSKGSLKTFEKSSKSTADSFEAMILKEFSTQVKLKSAKKAEKAGQSVQPIGLSEKLTNQAIKNLHAFWV